MANEKVLASMLAWCDGQGMDEWRIIQAMIAQTGPRREVTRAIAALLGTEQLQHVADDLHHAYLSEGKADGRPLGSITHEMPGSVQGAGISVPPPEAGSIARREQRDMRSFDERMQDRTGGEDTQTRTE